MSKYKDLYLEAKDILKKLYKKGAFDSYSAKDLLYICDEKSKAVAAFTQNIYAEGLGLQIFYNDKGLNYLHDLLTSTSIHPANFFYCDCFLLGFIERKFLTEEDKKFIKKHNLNIVKEFNFLPIRFKEGCRKTYMTHKELEISINYLCYLYALLSNDVEEINEALSQDFTPIAIFDNTEMSYNVHYNPMPYLATMPKFRPIDKNFVSDFKNATYVDDTVYFFHTYLPFFTPEMKELSSIIVALYLDKNNLKYEIFDAKMDEIEPYFLGFLDNLFYENGLPTNVIVNHRKLYSICYKSLKALNVEVEFKREDPELDQNIYLELVDIFKKQMNEDDIINDDFDDVEEVDEFADEDSYEYVS